MADAVQGALSGEKQCAGCGVWLDEEDTTIKHGILVLSGRLCPVCLMSASPGSCEVVITFEDP